MLTSVLDEILLLRYESFTSLVKMSTKDGDVSGTFAKSYIKEKNWNEWGFFISTVH